MTPEELINSIIAQAISTAATFTENVDGAAADLIAVQGGSYFEQPTNLTGFVPGAVEPDIPEVEDSLYTYQAEVDRIISMLKNELADFFNTYYPLENDAFDEATAWLVNTIVNGGTGVNPSVEDQIWQRARERVIADGKRVQNQIAVGFGSKGYTIVSGAMIGSIKESLFEQASNSGKASTDIASKQLEIEIETIKFAIGEANKSREMAMRAAADYIKAVAMAPADAVKIASVNSDVKAKMMSAAADWYRARQGKDELILKSKLAELDTSFSIYKHKGDKSVSSAQVDANALAAAADAYGKTASAALASLNSIVSTSVNSFQ